MDKKRIFINLVASITSLIATMAISFFLTPYIVTTVGAEAYGFVSLANNFVNYAQIFTLALNSMAARYITVSIHRNLMEDANKYFSTVVIGNMISSTILVIPAFTIVVYLEKLIEVPLDLIVDIKILFFLVFGNFLVNIVTSTYSIVTYACNRLELSAWRSIQSSLIKVVLLICAFGFMDARIWYIGLVSIICTVYVFFWDVVYKKKLLPELKLSYNYFQFQKVIILVSAGIWSVITKLGQILTTGIDLLITNLFIGASMMGNLAIAQTVPTAFAALLGTVSNIFAPQLTIYYAYNDRERLLEELIKSMKISGFFTNIPLIVFISVGNSFYSLWMPGEDAELLFLLTILIVIGTCVSGIVNSLFSVFTITNRLRINSLIILGMGILNIVMVIPLLCFTNIGIYAVVGVSTFNGIVKNLIFTPMYAAKCLEVSLTTFYPTVIRYVISTSVMCISCIAIERNWEYFSWIGVISVSCCLGIVGIFVNGMILFSRIERRNFLVEMKNKGIKK